MDDLLKVMAFSIVATLIVVIITAIAAVTDVPPIRTNHPFTLINQEIEYTCQIVQIDNDLSLNCLEGAK